MQSRIARTKRVLPEGSLYVDIGENFERRVSHSQEGAMRADVYARGVVREALKGRGQRKWLWRGNKAGLIWWAWTFLGGWVFDMVLPRMFGLRTLREIVERRAAGKSK